MERRTQRKKVATKRMLKEQRGYTKVNKTQGGEPTLPDHIRSAAKYFAKKQSLYVIFIYYLG